MKIVAQNKRISFDYFIFETYECGIVLMGTEIKSVRLGKVSINESFVVFKNNEAFLFNATIAKYPFGNIFNHDETRNRKLLLHKNELLKMALKVKKEGYTVMPVKLYFKGSLLKAEIALCKGKKHYDKREDLKAKDQQKRIDKATKYY